MLRYLKLVYLWRYWPKEILYFPLTVYVLLIEALRTRRCFYFAAANPEISLGGFAGDSKFEILQHVPEHLKPKTVLVKKGMPFIEVEQLIHHMVYPIIAKPDIGEGGFKVKKIYSVYELIDYHYRNKMDYLIQSFCAGPIELTILFHLEDNHFKVNSIVERIPFVVKGDGSSKIKDLMLQSDAGFYHQNRLKKMFGKQLEEVPMKGEIRSAGDIGNWDAGAVYKECSNLISPEFLKSFNAIMHTIGVFNYGRADIKCSRYSDLLTAQYKFLEINGVKGEPVQIYDGKYTLWQAYKIIFRQWNIIRQLSLLNIKKGFSCPNFFEGWGILLRHAWHKLH